MLINVGGVCGCFRKPTQTGDCERNCKGEKENRNKKGKKAKKPEMAKKPRIEKSGKIPKQEIVCEINPILMHRQFSGRSVDPTTPGRTSPRYILGYFRLGNLFVRDKPLSPE
jgi:hypothetical protein